MPRQYVALYCVKCRDYREVSGVQCPTCGGRTFDLVELYVRNPANYRGGAPVYGLEKWTDKKAEGAAD